MAVPRNATDRVEARCEGLALFPEKSLTTHCSGSIFIPLCKTGFHAWHALGRRNGDSAGFSLDWLDFSAKACYLIVTFLCLTQPLTASRPYRWLYSFLPSACRRLLLQSSAFFFSRRKFDFSVFGCILFGPLKNAPIPQEVKGR